MKFITWWQHFFGLRSDVETENDYRANYDGDDNDDDDDGGDGFQNGKFVRKLELNFSVLAGSFLSISRGETCKSERLLFYTQETLVVKSRIVSCYIIYVKLVQI